MKTIDANLLETITGGAAKDSTNPANLKTADSCPVPSAKNDSLAKAWNSKHGVTKNSGGNFNGSGCAPGAGD
jgi:hypothetical protein